VKMTRERMREALWLPKARRFLETHFGPELADIRLADVHLTPTIVHFCKDIRKHRLNLVVGTTGCGKTLGAIIRMKEAIANTGKEGEYARATDISLQFGRGGYLSQEKEKYLQALERAPWIVLDDLGAESHSDRFNEIFFHLVDVWTKREITGILITNLEPKTELRERYGERAWSRIVKWSAGDVWLSPDPDFRVNENLLKKYPKGKT